MVGVILMVYHASLLVRLRMVLVDASWRQTTRVKRVGDHLMWCILLHRLLWKLKMLVLLALPHNLLILSRSHHHFLLTGSVVHRSMLLKLHNSRCLRGHRLLSWQHILVKVGTASPSSDCTLKMIGPIELALIATWCDHCGSSVSLRARLHANLAHGNSRCVWVMSYVRISSIVLWGQADEVMSAAVMLLRSYTKLLRIVWRCLFCLKLPSCVRFLSHSLERSMTSKLRHMFWRWSSSGANNRLVLSLWLQSHHFLLVYQRLSQLCHVGGVLCPLHCCIKINFVWRLPLIVLLTSANNRACLLLDIGVRSKSLPSMLLITTCHCFSRWWSFVLGPSCSSFLRSCRTCCFVFFIIWKIEQRT